MILNLSHKRLWYSSHVVLGTLLIFVFIKIHCLKCFSSHLHNIDIFSGIFLVALFVLKYDKVYIILLTKEWFCDIYSHDVFPYRKEFLQIKLFFNIMVESFFSACTHINALMYTTMNQSHKSHNAPVPYPTIHHSECAHFCSEWCIVGYGTGALLDLWIRSILGRKAAASIIWTLY